MVNRLNIKNAEACAIATELAKELGITKTQVVIDALRAHLLERTGNAESGSQQ